MNFWGKKQEVQRYDDVYHRKSEHEIKHGNIGRETQVRIGR